MHVDICCIGELLVDFVALSATRSVAEVPNFRRCAGGAPANVAVGISRLGGGAGLIACVGQDCFGIYLEEAIRKEGVDTSGIQKTENASTTLAFVSLSAQGERDFSFLRNPGADTQLDASLIPFQMIESCQVLHIGSLSLSREPSRSATLLAIERARKASRLVSLDFNYRSDLWSKADAIRLFEELVPQVDILKLSEEEALLLSGARDASSAADALLAKGPRVTLVSLGAAGCLLATRSRVAHVSGFVAPCVDATGAGDSFMAAFLAYFVENRLDVDDGDRLVRACRFANAAASLTVQGLGAIPSLPTRRQVEATLASPPAPLEAS